MPRLLVLGRCLHRTTASLSTIRSGTIDCLKGVRCQGCDAGSRPKVVEVHLAGECPLGFTENKGQAKGCHDSQKEEGIPGKRDEGGLPRAGVQVLATGRAPGEPCAAGRRMRVIDTVKSVQLG